MYILTYKLPASGKGEEGLAVHFGETKKEAVLGFPHKKLDVQKAEPWIHETSDDLPNKEKEKIIMTARVMRAFGNGIDLLRRIKK